MVVREILMKVETLRNFPKVLLLTGVWFGLLAGLAAGAGADDQRAVVHVGVLARRGTEECNLRWSPTVRYLTRQIADTEFRLVPLDFDEVAPAVAASKVDFIVVNSSMYVELQNLYGVSRMATMKAISPGGHTTLFGGVIFCQAERTDINSIQDLKGKSFMGVDEASFGGWRAAWRELKANKLDPYRDFARLWFGGTHDQVVYAVRDGTVDAGTVSTSILEQMFLEGKIRSGEFKTINALQHDGFSHTHSTHLYPNWPIAKLRHTSNALAERVCVALLSMSEDSIAARSAQYAGWTVPMDYGEVDACLKALKIGIYKDLGKLSFTEVVKYYRRQVVVGVVLLMVCVGFFLHVLRLNGRLGATAMALQEEIADHLETAEALRRLSSQNRLVLESTGEGIFGLDLQGYVTFMNAAASQMIGWPVAELLGRSHHEIVHHSKPDGSPYPKTECPIYAALEDGRKQREVEVFWRRDGVCFPVEYISTPIYEGGELSGAVVSFRDITERSKAEDVLRRSEEYFRSLIELGSDVIAILDSPR